MARLTDTVITNETDLENRETQTIEEIEGVYYCERLENNKLCGIITTSTILATERGWLDNMVRVEDVEESEKDHHLYLKGFAPKKSQEQIMNELKTSIINSVQLELDKVAQSKGYDNGFACASYSYSTDEIFRREAQAYVEWRDKTWRYCYDLLDKYLAGEIEQPTIEYVLANMPKINWE